MRIRLRQGNRIVGDCSVTRFAQIRRELKRDGYTRAYNVLQKAHERLTEGKASEPLTEEDAKALHIATGATDNTRWLLTGRYWHGAVIESYTGA
jgi:hypothetical protein